MFELAVRNLLQHKARVVAMSISILVAVSFLSGSLALVDTLGATFDDLFEQINEETDAVVRSPNVVSASDSAAEFRATIPDDLTDVVRSVDGVAAVNPDVFGYAQLVDRDGRAMGNNETGAPTLGLSWAVAEELNILRLAEGAAPIGPTDVVIDKDSADHAGFTIGDEITVLTASGPHELTVVGIARFGEEDSALGASMAVFELRTAQALIGEPGRVSSIAVKAVDGVSETELRDRIATALPEGVEVVTGDQVTEESQDQVATALGFFNTFVVVFAAIAVFVSSFIIYNTFSILVVQRTRELALLRALGARRRQIVGDVVAEAALVGMVATGAGIILGVLVARGLRSLIRALGIAIPSSGVVVTTATVVTSIVVGLGVTVLAALIPARRASVIAPLAALREAAIPSASTGRPRVTFGAVTAVGGIAAIAIGLYGVDANGLGFVGAGSAALFVGVAALAPLLARPFARIAGRPLAWLRGVPGELAQENAMRNPKRTATTASALTIGVGLVAAISIFAMSAKVSIDAIVDKAIVGDFVIESGAFNWGGLSPELARELEQLDEVEAASGIRVGIAELDGTTREIFAVDPASIEHLADVDVREGEIADLGADDLAVFDGYARDHGIALGDTVEVRFPEGGTQAMHVAVLFADDDLTGNFFMSHSAHEANFAESLDFQVYVSLEPGADPQAARDAVEATAAPYANAEVQDVGEYKQGIRDQIDQLLGLIYALLALALIIALIGIANTLALTTHERTHELGLLRAVGMTRRQVRTTVRAEAILLASFGALLGLAIGVGLGWVLVQALGDFESFAVPVTQLAVVAVISIVAGLAAATRPAWRAARLDVLRAIADE